MKNLRHMKVSMYTCEYSPRDYDNYEGWEESKIAWAEARTQTELRLSRAEFEVCILRQCLEKLGYRRSENLEIDVDTQILGHGWIHESEENSWIEY
jgi:hypothetical protein